MTANPGNEPEAELRSSTRRPCWRRPRRVAAAILGVRGESGASHQQNGEETAGEHVERKAEAGPPYRDTGILNEQVMKGIESSVSGECGDDQPKVSLKACHGQL